MHPALLQTSLRQGGVFTARQARAVGYSHDELRSLASADGSWVRVRRGVYALAETAAAWSDLDRQLAADKAASLNMTTAHLLSHDSAARLLGLPLVWTKDLLIHITRPGVEGTRTAGGVRHHLGRMPPGSLTVGGFPATDLARTVLDLGREHGLVTGVCAADQALRRGVLPEDFQRELTHMGHWPHIRRARRAVLAADAGAESPAETLGRVILTSLGRGEVRTQFPFPGLNAHGSVWADLLLGSLVVEIDGRLKYGNGDGVLWEEKLRQHGIERHPVLVERLVWEEVLPRAWPATMERLAAAHDRALARFGPRLPAELEARAARLSGERHRRIYGDRRAS